MLAHHPRIGEHPVGESRSQAFSRSEQSSDDQDDAAIAAPIGDGIVIATGRTDADGRVASLGSEILEPGVYRLVFETGVSCVATSRNTFSQRVTINFTVLDEGHDHVPLLVSPFALSTSRGS